jgi:PAS domain S-box-containing protein
MTKVPSPLSSVNHRILVIDDNPSIHEDFRKVLCPEDSRLGEELDADEVSIFGDAQGLRHGSEFELDFASQGQEGLEKIRTAAFAGLPYAVAFVDMRMPPGWSGIETISRIWKEFPDLQIVICTAYSDYSWEDITRVLGTTDQILVLKKPFDHIEVTQMAHALCKKWQLTRIADRQIAELDALVHARTAELSRINARLTAEIAERSAAQDAMLSSEERFSKAFHSSPVPMAIQRTDAPGFLDANTRFFDLLGYERTAILSGEAAFWTDEATPDRIRDTLARQRTVQDMAAGIRTASGDTREVILAADNLVLGNAPYRLLILQDITERIRLETELRQSQNMESGGRLAAGVAHDFNNILSVILGNASLEIGKEGLDAELGISLQEILLAAERATALTRQLLAYSRKQIIRRRPLALNATIEHAASALTRLIGPQIAVDLRLVPEIPPIFADPSSVEQVVTTLALNARDAMPAGGRLTFTTSLTELDDAGRALHPGTEAQRFACLAVHDTGHGMDATTLAHIFEPFFTTKDSGRGTGLGLATVYGIIRQHGGWVEAESEPGYGSTFRVHFPLSTEAAPEKPAPSDRAPAVPRHGEKLTILLVEDENSLREFVTRTLGKFGYRVLAARNGERALEVWGEHRNEIDLLLTDVIMPDSMSGRQLAHRLMLDRPDLKVILTSGHSTELIDTEIERTTGHIFLPKPYRASQLTEAIATHFPAKRSHSVPATTGNLAP